jgi:light-regulated signal transduction histidine kinase (bacteriophytochrome)
MNPRLTSPVAGIESSSTEQKLRERIAELQMTNRMLADFAALVSHDLQSGLRGVGNFAALLRVVPEIESDQPTLAVLNTIQVSARKVKCITEESRVACNNNDSSTVVFDGEDDQTRTEVLQLRVSELESSRRKLADRACSVASELRKPLEHILSEAKSLTLLPVITDNVVSADMASRIYACAKQMQHLVEDYLSFFHSERQAVRTSRLSLESLVQLIRHELEPLATDRKVTWQIRSLPEVEADAPMLRQAILNLLSNALKYTRKCPEAIIEVGARISPNEVTLYVRDNGIGFDSNSARHLFRKFGRLHQDAAFEGAGIGLVIVQHIIHRHGGTVYAEATPGRGATFYFTLPIRH